MNEEIDRLVKKATLELLKKKEYKDIQMKEIALNANIGRRTLYRYFGYKDEIMNKIVLDLMDNLAEIINQNKMDLEGIAYSFFHFWELNMDELKLLKKAHLMYLLEDNLPDLVMGVSLKTKYKDFSPEQAKAIMDQMTKEDKYNLCYMLQGYFKVAQMWMDEKERKTPKEMAVIMKKIVYREFPNM